jgi:ATP phosphoribosyltransferase
VIKTDEATLTMALPKGRLMEGATCFLRLADIDCSTLISGLSDTRKLIFVDQKNKTRFLVVRSSDVPTYVQQGPADIGIVGKDVLDEGSYDTCELLDLGFGRCTMVVAALKEKRDILQNIPERGLKVATKFPNTARRYFTAKGLQADIVPLGGSVEIAPVLGMSDVIVDLVATGSTLRDNGLCVVEEISTSTARLIANRASLRFKNVRISTLIEKFTSRRYRDENSVGR